MTELKQAPFFYRFSDKEALEGAEAGIAWRCGRLRLAEARKRRARDRMSEDSELSHYWGALGEIAAARFLGISLNDWACPINVWNQPDIISPAYGPFEVRTVPSITRPYVKTKGNDNDSVPIMVVLLCAKTSAAPNGMGIVVGWALPSEIRAHSDKQDWGNRGAPAWMTNDLSFLHQTFYPRPTAKPSPASATDASPAPTGQSPTGPDGGPSAAAAT